MGISFDSDAKVGAGIDFSDPESSLAAFYFRFGDVVAVLVIAGIFVLLNFTPLWHTDIWGHLNYGELWLQSHEFPTRDVLSYMGDPAGGSTNYAWLSQVVLAETFRLGSRLAGGDHVQRLAGGVDALRFLLSVLVTLRLAFLFLAFRRLSNSSIMALAGVGFIVGISLGNLGVLRPQVFAEVLFALVIYILCRLDLGRVWTISLSATLIAWANAHGSFPIGLLTIGACWAGRGFQTLTDPHPGATTLGDQRFQSLTLVLLLSVFGITFLNPEGWHIWTKTASMANHPNVRAMDEWQPLLSPVAIGARITYVICLVWIGLSMVLSRRRLSPESMVLVIAFAIPPILHQRAVVWLITVGAWVSIVPLGQWLTHARPGWWASVPSFRRTILAIAIALIALLWSIPGRQLIDAKPPDLAKSLSQGTPWQLGMNIANSKNLPDTDLSKLLISSYPDGRFQGAIYTSETLGDFFLWPLKTPAPVYIYSHVHLFSPDHWKRYTEVRDANANWRAELNRAGVNLVVLYAEPQLNLAKALANDPEWKVVLDEAGDTKKLDPRCRLFAAIRVTPLLPKSQDVKQ